MVNVLSAGVRVLVAKYACLDTVIGQGADGENCEVSVSE